MGGEGWFVGERKGNYERDLQEWVLTFAVEVFHFLDTLPNRREFDVFRYQLSKAATSVGANYEEAQGAFSQREFASKIGICLKEARECYYFLKVVRELNIGDAAKREKLLNNASELKNIFAAILLKTRKDLR